MSNLCGLHQPGMVSEKQVKVTHREISYRRCSCGWIGLMKSFETHCREAKSKRVRTPDEC